MATLSQDDLITLEKMIDRKNVQAVLEGLSQICYEKAEHVRSNWQDLNLAKGWERAGKRLQQFAETDAIHYLS